MNPIERYDHHVACHILKPFIMNIESINILCMIFLLGGSKLSFLLISNMEIFLKEVKYCVIGPLLHHGRALVHYFKEAISSAVQAHIWKCLHWFCFYAIIQSSQMALCIFKLILVLMSFLHNASNFMFPTERHKARLQFVQMEWPSYQDHLCIQITFHGSDQQQKRSIKLHADVWSNSNCDCDLDVGISLWQNNFVYTLDLFAVKRPHQIEIEFFPLVLGWG